MANHVKVGLCGQGADELHAGYPRYGALTQHGDTLQQRMNALPDGLANALIDGSRSEERLVFTSARPAAITADLETMLNFELEHGQLSNFQLRLVDRHSMAHSLEVRVPFWAAPIEPLPPPSPWIGSEGVGEKKKRRFDEQRT